MYLSIGQTSRFLNVSISTLRRWDKLKKLVPNYITVGGHRRYLISKIKQFAGESISSSKRLTVGYCRVSSYDQKNDLLTQQKRISNSFSKSDKSTILISDLGSGLNFRKKGLNQLIEKICRGEIKTLVLIHRDRLLRFGSEIIFKLCDIFGTQVKILGKMAKKTFEEELVSDVLEIMTVFTAKIYGKRSHSNRLKQT